MKQTEKLLYKNNKMQEKISVLKRDIEIHKQIENELAKRSHSSQKTIKPYNDQVKAFEGDLTQIKSKNAALQQ